MAPAGSTTRPTADRMRQALFDMILHAPWGGRECVEGATVLDAFAGTGALGLEALSRGAASATFIENDRIALAALRANIAVLGATALALAADALRPPTGQACGLVFLDPPYAAGLGPRAITALRAAGWIDDASLVVLEIGRDETVPAIGTPLAVRAFGAGQVTIWRRAG